MAGGELPAEQQDTVIELEVDESPIAADETWLPLCVGTLAVTDDDWLRRVNSYKAEGSIRPHHSPRHTFQDFRIPTINELRKNFYYEFDWTDKDHSLHSLFEAALSPPGVRNTYLSPNNMVAFIRLLSPVMPTEEGLTFALTSIKWRLHLTKPIKLLQAMVAVGDKGHDLPTTLMSKGTARLLENYKNMAPVTHPGPRLRVIEKDAARAEVAPEASSDIDASVKAVDTSAATAAAIKASNKRLAASYKPDPNYKQANELEKVIKKAWPHFDLDAVM